MKPRETAPAARLPRAPLLAALALALAFAGAEFHGPFALLDNLSNFPAHFAAAFLACALLLARQRRALPALACLALAALALGRVLPWYFGGQAAAAEAPRAWTRVLLANVNYANRDHGRLLALVEREDPDVVALVEVTGRWLRQLEPLRRAYPHHHEAPGEHAVGLALYSRRPIDRARTLALPGEAISPAIAATLATAAGPVEFVLVHTTAPLGADYIRRRNAQVAALARHARDAPAPVVLAGDLNLTMWNAAYRPLAEVGGLHNARAGHGVGPTWPALGPLGVPIDHVLASPGVRLRNFRVLERIGSDHLPVSAEFGAR